MFTQILFLLIEFSIKTKLFNVLRVLNMDNMDLYGIFLNY